jgi:hypothetical protein
MRGEDEYEIRTNVGKPIKLWQIWVGNYHLGQGYDPPNEPEMIAEVKAATFDLACLKYELRTSLNSIEERERKGEYIDFQSRRWFYDWDNNSNGWTGKYFETKEEALQSFKHK